MSEPPARAVDAPERWQIPTYGLELVIAPAPAGTHGYDDLRRDAVQIRLGEDLEVSVVSLIDLVRLAEASTEDHDRARVPALRATLELATTSVSGDAAAA